MQAFAAEIGFSETTFVEGRSADGWDVRIFTPETGIPFAGHPTIGTARVVREHVAEGRPDRVVLDLDVGEVPVEVRGRDGRDALWMTQQPPEFGPELPWAALADVLSVDVAALDADSPVQIVSTGLPTIVVPLASRAALTGIELDRDAYRAVTGDREAKNVLAFCRDSRSEDNDLAVRMFAPFDGVPEDPATGSSNGCLAAYLVRHRVLGAGGIDVRVEQGHGMGRPSLLQLRARATDGGIRVEEGGSVVPVAGGTGRRRRIVTRRRIARAPDRRERGSPPHRPHHARRSLGLPNHVVAREQLSERRHRPHHRVAGGPDRVLRAVADRQPRDLQHRQVVGAVPDRDGPSERGIEVGRQRLKGVVFGADNQGALDGPGQPAVLDRELVRHDRIDRDARTLQDAFDAAFEPAGQDRDVVAGRAEPFDHVRRPGTEPHLVERGVGFRLGQSFEQRRPFPEALGVRELVVHRALGDLRHPVGDARALAEEHGHLRVGEGAVEVEGDESHTRAMAGGGFQPIHSGREHRCQATGVRARRGRNV